MIEWWVMILIAIGGFVAGIVAAVIWFMWVWTEGFKRFGLD